MFGQIGVAFCISLLTSRAYRLFKNLYYDFCVSFIQIGSVVLLAQVDVHAMITAHHIHTCLFKHYFWAKVTSK